MDGKRHIPWRIEIFFEPFLTEDITNDANWRESLFLGCLVNCP